mgnify:CR=1 FL=1
MGAGLSTTLTKAFKAEAAVTRRRIVKFGSTDDFVVQAAAGADLVFGVSSELDAAAGEVCDVHLAGIADVEFGGNVTRGQKLMADASGRAIAVAAGAGANVQVVGWAMVSAVLGDIGPLAIAPSTFQG